MIRKNLWLILTLWTIAVLGGWISLLTLHGEVSAQEKESSLPESHRMEMTDIEHLHVLALNPKNNTLFKGTHHGLYKSLDEGKTWQKLDLKGDLKNFDFMALVLDPTDSQVMYAAGHDMWVVKSTDGGISWKTVKNGLPSSDVHGLSIHPTDKRLHAWVVDKGLYRSKDGGASWQRVDDGPPADVKTLTVANVPTGMGGIWLIAATADGLYLSMD